MSRRNRMRAEEEKDTLPSVQEEVKKEIEVESEPVSTDAPIEKDSVHHEFLLMAHMWKGKRVAWIGEEFPEAQRLTEEHDAEKGPAQVVVIWCRMTREPAATRDEMMAYAKKILAVGGHIIIVDWCIQPGMVGAIRSSLAWSGFASARLELQSGPYGIWVGRKP